MSAYKAILIVHIAAGAIALVSGLTAICSKKGRRSHIVAGKVYVLSMYSVAVTAVVLTLMKFNPFLLSIALFAAYLTFSGQRAIDNWRLAVARTPTWKDRVPFSIALIAASFMIIFPVAQMIIMRRFFVPVLAVFGVVLWLAVIKDIRLYSNPKNFLPRQKFWLIEHIGRMGGAYIATTTAFLVNNVHVEPGWVIWLGPTIIGSPLIASASIKWSRKLKIGG